MKSVLMTLLFIPTLTVYAQADKGETQSEKEMSKVMYAKIEEVKNIPPKDYVTRTQVIRKEIDKYIDLKKGVCSGDYSTFVLDHKDIESSQHKLTKIEKDLCYRELRAFQVTYINNLFIAKKNYLNHLHDERLKKLEEIREETLRSLKATYDKQLISPKRNRKRR
ncbi:hypothetical protein ACRXCV_04785 [Halobacteriovorax sp. GFR7]|uniref:hypothetical protein n=1 Tax=unclassified Halobacteriovorax TaxID=2639665 RepID=UPI003710029D